LPSSFIYSNIDNREEEDSEKQLGFSRELISFWYFEPVRVKPN